jgi:hypothetical protein
MQCKGTPLLFEKKAWVVADEGREHAFQGTCRALFGRGG